MNTNDFLVFGSAIRDLREAIEWAIAKSSPLLDDDEEETPIDQATRHLGDMAGAVVKIEELMKPLLNGAQEDAEFWEDRIEAQRYQ